MASNFCFITVLAACLLVTVTALNCYTCNRCGQRKMTNRDALLCQGGAMGMSIPQCFHEVNAMGEINRGCTNRTDCTFRSNQRMERPCGPGVQPPCFSCCDRDNCNLGANNGVTMPTVSMATFLLILVPSFLSMFVSW